MKRAAALCAFLALALAAPSARGAEFGIVPGSLAIKMIDAEGNPETRAGSHPDRLQIDFALNVEGTGTSARDLTLELPPGLGGSADAVPACPRELFEKGEEECPEESRVGAFSIGFTGGGELTLPVFQLEPEPDETITFGSISGVDLPLTAELRPDDFGMNLVSRDLPQSPVVSEVHAELWGVPADRQTGTTIPRRPFLTAPTRCGPFTIGLRTRSWQADAPWLSASAEADEPLSGCTDLAFGPQLGLALTNPEADSPTGARIELSMPEEGDPDGLANAQIQNATIQLPEGLTVSPAGVAGLTACSDAQLGLGETTATSCPPSSRVGDVEFESPLTSEPLAGDLYLGEEAPGERFRMFIVAPGPGMVVKFVSALQADPTTGRLSTALRDLPQLPMDRLTLGFDGGPRALLASPLTCGAFAATGSFESHSGAAPVESGASLTVVAGPYGSPCPAVPPFAPSLTSSSSSHAAGRPTTFSMTLLRRAGEQLARRFSVSLPRGVSASLGVVETCPDSAAVSGTCPPGSRIGGAFAEVGAGASTVRLPGDVYAAGAYRRAPFSLVMAFRAAIGPFDLGRFAVRTAVQLDRRTGRITVVSDSLPRFIEGVPVRMRAIGMTMDSAGLVRNPTSCVPTGVEARFESDGGTAVTATSAFPVNGCDRLGFKPRFSMVLTGRSQLRKRGRPGVRISTRFRSTDTNLRAMHLSLPRALKFNVSGLREICPRRDAIDGLCSARSRVGTAYARSPLLRQPLRGSIYTTQPDGDRLPDLWLSLSAAGLDLDVRGRTSLRRGHMVTHLVGLPDMPISAFAMRLQGGQNGAMSLRAAPCDRGRRAWLVSRLTAKGQDGRLRRFRLRARASCPR